MTPVTALDIAGLRSSKLGHWEYRHACIWCGAGAWAGAFHSQCINAACKGQVAAPLDIIAETMFSGDYLAAGALVRKRLGIHDAGEVARITDRRVLDFWLSCCNTQPSSEAQLAIGYLARDGKNILSSRFGATLMDRRMIDDMIKLADETGATFPESWLVSPPASCAAFCVQTVPYRIDRIVLLRNGPNEVVWDTKAAGVSGLIGLMPDRRRLLVADFDSALQLQARLASNGYFEEVASVFVDPWKEETTNRWYPEAEMLTAVVDGAPDIIRIQAAVDKFTLLGEFLRGMLIQYATGHGSPISTKWDHLRAGYIETRTPAGSKRVSAEGASLFEQTGSKTSDAARIVGSYRRRGDILLADDFQKLAANRIIYREARTIVRETSGDYTVTTSYGTSSITNFHLRVTELVMFRDRPDVYCRGVLTCRDTSRTIVFPRLALQSNTTKLQEALHTHLAISGGPLSGEAVPTVIDSGQFQKFIVKHLNSQVASVPTIEGISRLGWSDDRKAFHAPGLTLTADGRQQEDSVIYPGIAALTMFDGVKLWSDACPADLPQPCQDLIAMLVAMAVRHFRRSPPRPALVLQTSDASALLEGLSRATGQRHIFELGQNARDTSGLAGLHGYPFVASGYGRAQAHKIQMPCVILTDEGYHVTESVDRDQVDAAGRALQFALVRAAEWCLATGADEFKEVQSMDYHTSLMREGQWLLKNVCDLEPWEVSVTQDSSIERLFAQIPLTNTRARMLLTDGVTLRVDIAGLEFDAGELTTAFASMGAKLTMEESSITTDAAVLLPALDRFYGTTPELAVVNAEE